MDGIAFSKKTFTYFDGARRNVGDAAWFEAHRGLYAEHVELPLTHLVMELDRALSPLLPGIVFSPRKLQKPLLRRTKNAAGEAIGPALRTSLSAHFAETSASMFETNPGVYISMGTKEEDNVIGCGLYELSSRQMHLLRPAFLADHVQVDGILKARALRKHWAAGLTGETYKRFPKEYDEAAPGAEYLWHKRLLLSRHVTRDEVLAPGFIAETVAGLKAAAPFVSWLRATAGVYKRPVGGYGVDRE